MGDKTAVDGDLGGIRERGEVRESGTLTPSTLFKDDGSGPESEERRERKEDCYFHLTLASAGEGLGFSFHFLLQNSN